MKKCLKIIALVLAVVLVAALGYVGYVFGSYHRLGDAVLTAEGTTAPDAALKTGESYKITGWNIGFGAYTADYDFFMDGGKQSWAESPERLKENLSDIASVLQAENADICLLQEVDVHGTRTYKVDEREALVSALSGKEYCRVTAMNYDSPYLLYPLYQPHGANQSCILTLSSFPVTGAARVELPIEESVTKILDLDRCYSVCRIPCGDKELVLYNLHLSAYTSDGSIAETQLNMLIKDMQREYENGNWCIAGGDFNKDVLGSSPEIFGTTEFFGWAQPIPEGTFDGTAVRLIAPLDADNPVASCRNPDSAWHPGQFVVTVDGFMVTDNVEVLSSTVVDLGYAYSDHNPVNMEFRLKEE